MQTNLFQRLFTSRATPISAPALRSAAAPVQLQTSALKHVAGGSPHGAWVSSATTTSSPHGAW